MSVGATSARESSRQDLDQSLAVLKENARGFARTPPAEKAKVLRETMETLRAVIEGWAAEGSRARGGTIGEELLMGPAPTMRNLRLLAQTLETIGGGSSPVSSSQVKTRPDGRVEVSVYPTSAIDGAVFPNIHVHELMTPGTTASSAVERAGAYYKRKDPEGGVSLILGAGNVASIPPTDALYKSFAEGFVTLVKINPVNEWVGPFLETAFEPMIRRGWIRFAYGAGEVGGYLVNHAAVDDVHITGSNHTHDLIVWGPPGPERERRKKEKDPVLKKRITSELGNVSPVAIVPCSYSESELDFVALNAASMVIHNASFNCNAAKILITAKGWPQRDAFFEKLAAVFQKTPTRKAYYPGAHDRYRRLTEGRDTMKFGEGDSTRLPWTLIRGVDPSNTADPIFSTEPFCSLISDVALDANEPVGFLQKATSFMNDTVWGTLTAMLIVPQKLEASAEVGRAVDKAILDLRYGTVTINQWAGAVFGLISPAWGGHPSSTLENIQSGIGWVHNTFLLEDIEKTVLRGPLVYRPKPPWMAGHKTTDTLARRLTALEYSPSWLKMPGIAFAAVPG